jgi:hypothetical protein
VASLGQRKFRHIAQSWLDMCAIFAAKTLSFQNVQLNDDVHRFLLFPLNEGSALKVRLSVNAYLPQPPTLHPARILIFCASAQLHYQAMC